MMMFARVSIYKQLVAKAKHKLGSSGRHDNINELTKTHALKNAGK